MNVMETGKRIQQLRKGNGWTQRDLAEKLNVTVSAVSKWERGLNFPDMAMLEPLALVLETSVVELLCIADEPDAQKVASVTAVAVEQTERLKKETRQRAFYGMLMSFVIFAAVFYLGRLLIGREVYDLPLRICYACLSIVGFLAGNYLWIWWKYRK